MARPPSNFRGEADTARATLSLLRAEELRNHQETTSARLATRLLRCARSGVTCLMDVLASTSCRSKPPSSHASTSKASATSALTGSAKARAPLASARTAVVPSATATSRWALATATHRALQRSLRRSVRPQWSATRLPCQVSASRSLRSTYISCESFSQFDSLPVT